MQKHRKDGTLLWEGAIVAGNLEGVSTYYFSNGKVASTVTYKEGKKEGEARFYDTEGHAISIQNFKNGVPDATQKFFYVTGALKTTLRYKAGQLYEVNNYYPDGNLRRSITLEEGKRHGLDRYIEEDGSERFVFEYERGLISRVQVPDRIESLFS